MLKTVPILLLPLAVSADPLITVSGQFSSQNVSGQVIESPAVALKIEAIGPHVSQSLRLTGGSDSSLKRQEALYTCGVSDFSNTTTDFALWTGVGFWRIEDQTLNTSVTHSYSYIPFGTEIGQQIDTDLFAVFSGEARVSFSGSYDTKSKSKSSAIGYLVSGGLDWIYNSDTTIEISVYRSLWEPDGEARPHHELGTRIGFRF